jgi:hypothetical protein
MTVTGLTPGERAVPRPYAAPPHGARSRKFDHRASVDWL